MSDVEETIVVPKKATEAMTKAGVKFALTTDLSSDYPWSDYIADLWAVMVANAPATPKPDTSPVCVEVATLTKVRNLRDRLQGFTPGSWEASLYITANEIEAELINARSVADVRAELLAEMMADATNRAADTNGRPGAGSLNEMYCHAMDYIKAFRRSLTEGEG